MRRWKKPVKSSNPLVILLIVVAVWAVSAPSAAAQFTSTAYDARSGAMGGSLFLPADEGCATLGYRSGYRLQGLADKQLGLWLPLGRRGIVAAAYMHHGTVDYHEQQATAGYQLRVAEWLKVGVAARWLQVGTSDAHYPARQWLAAEAMLQALAGGTALTLLGGTRPWDDAHPWRWHLNMRYTPAGEGYGLVAELEQEELLRLRLGMEYAFRQRWFLRAGMATRPVVMTFGGGVRLKQYSIDLAAEVHSSLGITPHTTLTLWF